MRGVVAAVPEAESLDMYPYYSQYPLDRKAEWRRDKEQIAKLLAHPRLQLLPVFKDKALVKVRQAQQHQAGDGQGQQAGADSKLVEAARTASVAAGSGAAADEVKLDPVLICAEDDAAAAEALDSATEPRAGGKASSSSDSHSTGGDETASSSSTPKQAVPGTQVFLGLDAKGQPYFAVEVTSLEGAKAVAAATGGEWRSARVAGPELADGDASLVAVASSKYGLHDTFVLQQVVHVPDPLCSLPSIGMASPVLAVQLASPTNAKLANAARHQCTHAPMHQCANAPMDQALAL